MFKNIHHVAIIASNYEVSKSFYVDVLGFEVIRENYRIDRNSYKLDLKIGDSEIELFSFPNSPKRPSYPEACGLRHLCFKVDDIEEAVKWLNDKEVLTEDVVGLAKGYYEKGADELLILDLSDDDDDHEETLNILRRITRVVRIPVSTGGNVKRLEDVKKILYAGAKRVIINFSRKDGTKLLEAAEKRFGKEKKSDGRYFLGIDFIK